MKIAILIAWCGLFVLPGQDSGLTRVGTAAIYDAQYHLGVAYQKGKGVAKNTKRAEEWFSKAAKGGHREAQKKLEALLEQREWAATHPGWTALTLCPAYGAVPYCRETGR
jgi:TPR repeat protein